MPLLSRHWSNALPVIGLLALLTVVLWLIYAQALPGRWLYDDAPNLQGLRTIVDVGSALSFILSGEAGPLGRPLALLSFALQAEAWPNDPARLLRVNIMVHLLAVWAAFLLATGLARLRTTDRAALWIGLAVAVLWGASPFLATTHLMIVQRMTGLAGLWTLLGLAAVVWAHSVAARWPGRARLLLLLGLGVATPLAALSKENGALLPLLAAVIVWLWVPTPQRLRSLPDRLLIAGLLVVPALLVLGYLLLRIPGVLEAGPGHRYYTPLQRLFSQPVILWEYLRYLLFPQVAAISPFMDNLPAARGWLDPPSTLWSVLAWVGVLGAALWWRRAAPWLLFGAVFFLAGHLVESSVIHLELYFAHRNYVPAFGVYFALVWAVSRIPSPWWRLARLGLTAYVLALLLILLETTLTWSQPQRSAPLWLAHNPYSERAVQFRLEQHFAAAEFEQARQVLETAAALLPDRPLLQIQLTQVCGADAAAYAATLAQVRERLRSALYRPEAAAELARAAQQRPRSPLCRFSGHAVLASLADALLDNPRYRASPSAVNRLELTRALAEVAAETAPTE